PSTGNNGRFADAGRRSINRSWPVFRLDLAENGRGGPPRADSVPRWQHGIRLVRARRQSHPSTARSDQRAGTQASSVPQNRSPTSCPPVIGLWRPDHSFREDIDLRSTNIMGSKGRKNWPQSFESQPDRPLDYFHLVFTLPAEIAPIAYQNKAVVYHLLFRTAAETLLTIAADPKHLGARIGATAVLHTWGSAMTHHPHVHMIVPGGGISLDGTRWLPCRPGFLLPARVLSRLFRRLFLAGLADAHAAGRL